MKIKRTWVKTELAIIMGLIFTSCEPPTEAETTGSIEGIIYDASTSQQLGGVTVTTEPITSSKITDTNGGYNLEGIEPETYTLQAAKSGFNTNSTTVNVIAGETTTADLQLTPLAPELSVSTVLLNYGTSATNLTFTVTNTGVGVLTWNVISTANWITVNPANGSTENESDVVTVTVNRTAMSYGNHYETITIASNANSKTIDVLMTIQNPNAPQLSVYPVSMDFGNSETEMSFNIQNTGTGLLTWNVTDDQSWISILPQSGTTESEVDELVVTIDRLNQSPGVQTGTITVSSDGGNQSISVQFTIPDEPTLSIIPASLDFSTDLTILPFSIANAGSGDLSWSVSDNQEWITTSPAAGTNDGTVNVSVSRDGIPPGDYSGTVTVSSNGGTDGVEIIMAVPADEPPTAVELVIPTEISDNSIALSWTRNFDTDFAAYKIYRDLSPAVTQDSEIIATIINSSENQYTDTGLQASTTYYYRVYVMDTANQYTPSNIISATTQTQLGSWSVNTNIEGICFYDVDALNENFVYAVGSEGSLYFNNGTGWSEETHPATYPLNNIEIISQTDMWIKTSSTIYHYDGISWSTSATFSTYSDFEVVSSDDIYIGGRYGQIHHYDGTEWTAITVDASHIVGIQMESAESGWAVDATGKIFYYNGFGWSLQQLQAPYSVSKFIVFNSSDIWTISDSKINHWNGVDWTEYELPNRYYVYDYFQFSSNSIWFVGGYYYWEGIETHSLIRFWDGVELHSITSPTDERLYGITMMSETDGWAVGNEGVVLRYH